MFFPGNRPKRRIERIKISNLPLLEVYIDTICKSWTHTESHHDFHISLSFDESILYGDLPES